MTKAESEDKGIMELKKAYELFAKKYSLPSFDELNVHFEIEEISPDTELLLKRVRRMMIERISGYMRFVDLLINPSSSSLFFYKKVKKLTSKDREFLSSAYEILGDLETESLLRDLDYDEAQEGAFIKKIALFYSEKIKKGLMHIVETVISIELDEKFSKNSSGSYFG